MSQSCYTYGTSVTFKDGRWDVALSHSGDSPSVGHWFKHPQSQITPGIQRLETARVLATQTRWDASQTLSQAEEAPAFDIQLSPPAIFVDTAGFQASVMIVFNVSDNQPALTTEGWSMEVDLSRWFGDVANVDLENEAISAEGHIVSKYFYGTLAKALSKAKIRCQMNIKDQFIATGYTFGFTFTVLATVYKVSYRPAL